MYDNIFILGFQHPFGYNLEKYLSYSSLKYVDKEIYSLYCFILMFIPKLLDVEKVDVVFSSVFRNSTETFQNRL